MQKHPLFILVIAFLPLLPYLSYSEQNSDSTSFWQNEILAARFHYGVVIAHHADIENLVTGHTYGFEVDLFKQADGSQSWHNQYHLPQTGFIYIHLNLANADVLGDADGIMYAIRFPLTYRSENLQFAIRLACGLGWLSKTFDRVENNKDLTIGSHLNAAIQINFEEKIKLSRRLYTNFDIGLTHFSNGAFKYPNLGVNNASASIGFNYLLTPFHSEKNYISERAPENKTIHYELIAAAGTRAIDVGINNSYFSSTLSFAALKQVNDRRLLGFGLDIFYDPGLKSDFQEYSVTYHNSIDLFRSGFYFDHEQLVGRTSIVVQVGAYIYDQYKEDGMIYDRLGFKYRFSKKYFANVTLKAHIAKADYVEWGVGMRI